MLSPHRATLRFGSFRFDPVRLHLQLSRKTVPLRPKTAALLALLLTHRNRVVSKREIRAAVWAGGFVSEQSLFQAVSELRRTLAPLEAVITHPNQGYRWVAPVYSERPVVRAAAAALVTIGGSVLALLAFAPGQAVPASDARALALPPALEAFQTGLRQLAQHEPATAEVWFRLALRENPAFAEARLMTAESLLAQGQTDAARAMAQSLLPRNAKHDASGATNAYTAVAAMALLGRSEMSSGQAGAGLRWSRAAAGQAREEGFLCVAAQIEDRIDALLTARGPAGAGNSDPDEAAGAAPLAAALGDLDAVDAADLPGHCRQMRSPTPREARPGQTGECLDSPIHAARDRRRSA